MTIRVVASPASDGNYSLVIQGANFSGSKVSAAENSGSRHGTGVGPFDQGDDVDGRNAQVYVALKIGPDGTVQDGDRPTSELDRSGQRQAMEDARVRRWESSLALVREWTFNVPTQGKFAGQTIWSG